jgi:anti-sigma B factor antagonist
VTFIDSEALGALIDGYNEARAKPAGYRVVNANGLVARVLKVSGVLELFGA